MQKKRFPLRVLLIEAGLLVIEFFIFKYFYREYDITLGFDRLASVVFVIFVMLAFDCIIAACALIPNTAEKYKLKRFLAIIIGTVALTAGATALMCNYVPPEGSVLEIPTYAQTVGLTMQEMENGVAVSGEVSLTDKVEYWKKEDPDDTYFGTKYFKKTNQKRPIEGEEKSFVYRFLLTDGTERTFSIFSDDTFNYIEEPGIALWRYKRGKTDASNYVYAKTTYEQATYNQAFGQYTSEKNFTIMPGYNGAGKVICLIMEEGKIPDWSTFRVPEELAAQRAEDVRYIVLVEQQKRVYTGYWYNPETGEKVSDAYDDYYFAAAYDLETGETTVFEQMANGQLGIWDKVGSFLDRLE